MKRSDWNVFLLMAFVMIAFVGCTVVEPGYEGVRVVKSGDGKGIDSAPVVVGRVWYNPFTTDIVEFPTYTRVVTWTESATEESPNDDSITFNSVEGATIKADISLAFNIIPGMAGKVFMKYHCIDIDDLTWRYMRLIARDAITSAASKRETIKIIGIEKQALLDEAKEIMQEKVRPFGVNVDTLAFVGELRPSESVRNSINAVIEATQLAKAAEENVKTAKAKADQAIESAKGELESSKMKAEANNILKQTLTAEFLKYRAIEKWDGVLPKVTGPTVPLVDIK